MEIDKTYETNTVERVLETTLTKLKTLVQTETVIGSPVHLDCGTTVVPISKVIIGYVGGGGEQKNVQTKKHWEQYPFMGGSGAAVSLSPIGFLSITENEMKLIRLDNQSPYEKLIDVAADFITKEAKSHVKKD